MQDWENYTPPHDIEIDGARHTAPDMPPPGVGPDTDVLITVGGYDPGVDPIRLLPPYNLYGKNAAIPAKGVAGVGPQPGTAENVYENLGTVILPGWQRYLEMGGQLQVGILPRTVPVQVNELWDQEWTLNPGIEVV